jgi:epoxyqueuosine reductase
MGSGGPGAFVDVMEVLTADDDHLLDRFGRWYLAERDPRWLRRNALVILGNIASTPVDEPVLEVLRHYLSHRDPMLRAHAVWAAGRLGRPDLVSALVDDPDPDVRAELAQVGA